MNLPLKLGRLGKAHASRSIAGVGIVGLVVAGLFNLPISSQQVDRTIELPILTPIVSSDLTSEQVDVKEKQPVRLSSAQIALKDAQVTVSLSQAQLAQARINLSEFQAKHNNVKILSAQGKVNRKQADLAVAAYKLAQLQHSSASIGLQDSQAQLIAAKAEVSKLGCKANTLKQM